MVQQFCHSFGKSFVERSEHDHSCSAAVLVRPVDDEKGKKKIKQHFEAEAEEEKYQYQPGNPEILCPFHVVVRHQQVGGKWFSEVGWCFNFPQY